MTKSSPFFIRLSLNCFKLVSWAIGLEFRVRTPPVLQRAEAECSANGLILGCVFVVKIVFRPMLSTFSMILIDRSAFRSSRDKATLLRDGRMTGWRSISGCDVKRLRRMSAPDAKSPERSGISGDDGRCGEPSVMANKKK
jgi:hypothetical protein